MLFRTRLINRRLRNIQLTFHSHSRCTRSHLYSTVPSAHDVLVPETLLKKRKSDAKAREEKAAKAAETKKVSISL